jgi:hypothetical protein
MDRTRLLALSAALCLAGASVRAQPAPPAAPSAAGVVRAGPGYTMGWALMTPDEQREHRAKMNAMTNAKFCTDYVAQHHRLMVERAKELGEGVPPPPRTDVCAGLK